MSTQSTRKRLRQDAERKANRIFREAKLPIGEIGYRIDVRRYAVELFVHVDQATAAAFDRATLHRVGESGVVHLDVRRDRKKQVEQLLEMDPTGWSRVDMRLVNRQPRAGETSLFPPVPAKAVGPRQRPQPQERTPLPWQVPAT